MNEKGVKERFIIKSEGKMREIRIFMRFYYDNVTIIMKWSEVKACGADFGNCRVNLTCVERIPPIIE